MKKFIPKWIFYISFGASICYLASCSEEIVVIEEIDRTELDSLDNLIIVTTDDLTATKIAKNALNRRIDSLNQVIADAQMPNTMNPDVVFTVHVLNGSQTNIAGRSVALAGAVVTVSQGNSSTELTTDNTGMVTFSDMESGIVSLTVEIANYSDVYMIVDLRDNGTDPDNSNAAYRNASTQVMVFPTTGEDMFTISGVGYYNQNTTNLHTDAQNDPAHPLTGLSIFETTPSGSNFAISCVPSIIPLNHTRPGRILQVVYAGLQRVATMGANGSYSVEVPSVLLNSGGSLFTYSGPDVLAVIQGVEVNAAPVGNINRTWFPTLFFPTSFADMIIYPGGSVITDVYYF